MSDSLHLFIHIDDAINVSLYSNYSQFLSNGDKQVDDITSYLNYDSDLAQELKEINERLDILTNRKRDLLKQLPSLWCLAIVKKTELAFAGLSLDDCYLVVKERGFKLEPYLCPSEFSMAQFRVLNRNDKIVGFVFKIDPSAKRWQEATTFAQNRTQIDID